MAQAPRARRVLLFLLVPISFLAAYAAGPGPPRGSGGVAAGQAAPRDHGEAQPAAGAQVLIENFTYSPARLTVKAGTRVTWVNRDDVPHSVTGSARPRPFDSRLLDTGQRFSHVFTARGTYDYFCTLHPRMTGRVLVK